MDYAKQEQEALAYLAQVAQDWSAQLPPSLQVAFVTHSRSHYQVLNGALARLAAYDAAERAAQDVAVPVSDAVPAP